MRPGSLVKPESSKSATLNYPLGYTLISSIDRCVINHPSRPALLKQSCTQEAPHWQSGFCPWLFEVRPACVSMFPPPPPCPRSDKPIALSTYAAPAAVVTVDLNGHRVPKITGASTIDNIAFGLKVSSEDEFSPAYPEDRSSEYSASCNTMNPRTYPPEPTSSPCSADFDSASMMSVLSMAGRRCEAGSYLSLRTYEAFPPVQGPKARGRLVNPSSSGVTKINEVNGS